MHWNTCLHSSTFLHWGGWPRVTLVCIPVPRSVWVMLYTWVQHHLGSRPVSQTTGEMNAVWVSFGTTPCCQAQSTINPKTDTEHAFQSCANHYYMLLHWEIPFLRRSQVTASPLQENPRKTPSILSSYDWSLQRYHTVNHIIYIHIFSYIWTRHPCLVQYLHMCCLLYKPNPFAPAGPGPARRARRNAEPPPTQSLDSRAAQRRGRMGDGRPAKQKGKIG